MQEIVKQVTERVNSANTDVATRTTRRVWAIDLHTLPEKTARQGRSSLRVKFHTANPNTRTPCMTASGGSARRFPANAKIAGKPAAGLLPGI